MISATQHNNWTTQLPFNNSLGEEKSSTSNGGKYLIYVFYAVVFVPGFFGNVIIITSVLKFKKMRTVFNVFLVNLATADILFIILSTFNLLKFIYNDDWIFGDIYCRIHGTLIETSYTVSACTLASVATERYVTICHPQKNKRTIRQAVNICAFLWIFSVLFCGVLLYGSHERIAEDGTRSCSNDNWSNKSRLIFFTVHSVVVYLIPLGVMCFSHALISRALVHRNVKPVSSFSNPSVAADINKVKRRQPSMDALNAKAVLKRRAIEAAKRSKIIRLLIVVTVIFFISWTPYVLGRILRYSTGIKFNKFVVVGIQILILSNTAVNCFIYALMNPEFRKAFKAIICLTKLNKIELTKVRSCTISSNVEIKSTAL